MFENLGSLVCDGLLSTENLCLASACSFGSSLAINVQAIVQVDWTFVDKCQYMFVQLQKNFTRFKAAWFCQSSRPWIVDHLCQSWYCCAIGLGWISFLYLACSNEWVIMQLQQYNFQRILVVTATHAGTCDLLIVSCMVWFNLQAEYKVLAPLLTARCDGKQTDCVIK